MTQSSASGENGGSSADSGRPRASKPPNRLPAAKKAIRDAQIVVDRANRLPWAKIAEKHDMSDRQVREVYTAGLQMRALATQDLSPDLVIQGALDELDALSERIRSELGLGSHA